MTGSGPFRLLLSARDPAAAHGIAALHRMWSADPRFELQVVAQSPAWELLGGHGVAAIHVPGLRVTSPASSDVGALLSLADDVLHDFRPDALLTGLSGPHDCGIDEALQERCDSPRIVLQDFWGEQNRILGGHVELALVLDDLAAELTRAKHGTHSLVVGSPRHAEYAAMDLAALRTETRRRFLPRQAAATAVGLFGQPLSHKRGYYATVQAWAQEIRALAPGGEVAYRPHPRESAAQIRETAELLQRSGLSVTSLAEASAEESLLACDVVCTMFSNCAYDAAYLNRFSDAPLVVPVLMLFEPDMQAMLETAGDYRALPYFRQDLALSVWERSQLGPVLAEAFAEAGRNRVWKAAHRHLHDPRASAHSLTNHVLGLRRSEDPA